MLTDGRCVYLANKRHRWVAVLAETADFVMAAAYKSAVEGTPEFANATAGLMSLHFDCTCEACPSCQDVYHRKLHSVQDMLRKH